MTGLIGKQLVQIEVNDLDDVNVTSLADNHVLSYDNGTSKWVNGAPAAGYTHPNHSGEVVSSADGAQVISDNVVDEANLKISNTGTNGHFLSYQSGNTGGLTWAAAGGGGSGGAFTSNDNVTYRNLTGGYQVHGAGNWSEDTNDGSYNYARYNVIAGYRAAYDAEKIRECVIIGDRAGYSHRRAWENIVIGSGAAYSCYGASYNVVIGSDAGGGFTNGSSLYNSYHTFIGMNAGSSVTTGLNCTFLGREAGNYGGLSGTVGANSNKVGIGNAAVTSADIQVSWSVASDARDKTDFVAMPIGLDFVNALQPYVYRWDKRDNYIDKTNVTVRDEETREITHRGWEYTTDLDTIVHDGTHKEDWSDVGFKAQDVVALEAANGFNLDDKTNLVTTRTADGKRYGLQYEKFVPILVKALQELSAKNTALEARIATLEAA